MLQPEEMREKISSSDKANDKKAQLTLQDLQTVIEIFQGTYNFSAAHPEIKCRYINNKKSYAESGEKIAFFQKVETEMQGVINIYLETKAQTQNDLPYDKILVSENNCCKLEALLIEYFQKPHAAHNCHALVQLDGVMTNFNNMMGKWARDNTPLGRLSMLAGMNLLPLPAAEKYLLEQLNDANNPDLFIKTIANSYVESALILLKHLSPSVIFKKDPQIANNALELAIAKGRHHFDSDKRSSLTLGCIIDTMFAIIKKENLDVELFHNIEGDNIPPIALAVSHGDVKSTTYLLELGVFKPETEQDAPGEASGDIPPYEQMSAMISGYTICMIGPTKQELKSEDETCYHYDTYSLLIENEWKIRTEECKVLIDSYRHPRNSKVSP